MLAVRCGVSTRPPDIQVTAAFKRSSGLCYRSVVVTMALVRVVQMTLDEIVDVVAMRHGFMPAASAMHMRGIMPSAAVVFRTILRVGRGDLDPMLVHMIAVHVVQIARRGRGF